MSLFFGRSEGRVVGRLDASRGSVAVTLRIEGFTDVTPLAGGGFGSVYRAIRASTGGVVALKVLDRAHGDDDDLLERRLRREIAALVALKGHPNVVQVEQVVSTASGPAIVMEFMSRGSVLDVDVPGDIRAERVAFIGAATASGLQAAHDVGIVHRDVKPQNILVNSFGTVKLCDFGIAAIQKSAEFQTRTTALSVRYASPEELDGDPKIGTPTDVYSLGASMFHLLYGEPPSFRGGRGADPSITRTGRGADAARDRVSTIIERCLAEDPRRRPDGERLLRDAVGDVDGLGVAATGFADRRTTPSSPGGPRRHHRRTTRAQASAGGCAAVRSALRAPLRSAHPPRRPGLRSSCPPCDVQRAMVAMNQPSAPRTSSRWPTGTEYAAAVQQPTTSFADPELQQGRLTLTPLGIPASASGQNAIAFHMEAAERPVAVRCLLSAHDDGRLRYRALQEHVEACDVPSVVAATWLDEGVRVDGQWWPVVVMPWVSGDPLHIAVEDRLDDSLRLSRLADRWLDLVEILQDKEFAHGDYQHGNVLLTGDDEFQLVDLDGIWVPDMGVGPPNEYGHPNYQHINRSDTDWGPYVDTFSALVIALSMLALASDPSLSRFMTGENLLFAKPDFDAPERAEIWKVLASSSDPEVVDLTARLHAFARAGRQPAMSVQRSTRRVVRSVRTAHPRRPHLCDRWAPRHASVGTEDWWTGAVPAQAPNPDSYWRGGTNTNIAASQPAAPGAPGHAAVAATAAGTTHRRPPSSGPYTPPAPTSARARLTRPWTGEDHGAARARRADQRSDRRSARFDARRCAASGRDRCQGRRRPVRRDDRRDARRHGPLVVSPEPVELRARRPPVLDRCGGRSGGGDRRRVRRRLHDPLDARRR